MHVLQCAPLSLDAGVAVLALYPGLWMEDASPQGLMIRLSKYGTQQSAFSQPTRATMDLCNRLPRFKMEPKWYQSQWTQPFGCGIQLPVSARCSNASTAHKASFSAIMMEINFHQHCMMASSTYAIRLLVSTRFEGSMAIVLQALPGLQMEFNSRRHQGVMPSRCGIQLLVARSRFAKSTPTKLLQFPGLTMEADSHLYRTIESIY